MKPDIVLDRARPATPQLYEILRQRIVSLDFLPGAALSRVELSAGFNISQTPVREALLKLAEEQLVDVYPQAATKVSLIDVAVAHEAQFLRRSIELEIVRELSMNLPTGLIERLDEILVQQEHLRDQQDYSSFTQTDQEFHHCMYEAAGKEALWALVRSRSGHIDRLRRLHLPVAGKLERIVNDHRRVLDSLRQGDAAGAQQNLRAHLSETLEYVGRIQADYPQYFTAAPEPAY